jgi:nitrite reductase/ring-hydroxylating ferredoxin subunit/uncharacterized membrane protein
MRSAAHFKSHPIHPMLIPFPFAYLFGSAAVNAWARATGRPQWYRTADHMSRLGIASALLAAVPGIVDYFFAVPPKSSAKERATKHALANVSALALFTAARASRRHPDAAPHAAAVLAELAGAGLLGVGGWLGGTLVYRNQIGVDHRYADAGKWQVESATAGASGEVDAGAAEDVSVGQMKLLRAGDRRIVIARTSKGLAAFDDRCPHRGGPLSDGALAGDIVQCPWHGSQFDVHDGSLCHGPAEEGIRTYAVSERGGRVFVDLTERELAR